MNKVTKILTGTATTLVLGAGLIFGNAVFTLCAFAPNNHAETQPVITPDLSIKPDVEDNIVVLSNSTGKSIFLAQSSESVKEQMNEVTDISKEEQERRIAEKLRINGYTEDEIVKKMEGIKKELENPVYVEGTPSANDIAVNDAIDIAKSAIQEKYALTDETLKRFSVHTGFNVVDPEHPTWHIDFYPTIQSDFAEIGCYYVVLDSVTGEIIQISSAADGRG